MRPLAICASLIMLAALAAAPAGGGELREYQGKNLSPYDRSYDNSIRGPQKVDPAAYRLRVDGLVERPLELSYGQVKALGHERRVVLMPCVEGWTETLLYDGAPLAALLAKAGVMPGATWAVFHSADGYSTAMPLEYLARSRALLGWAINGLPLDQRRGFPFQLVAEGKLGYKWAKWITRVELAPGEILGYWEKRGYGNQADYRPSR